ncbi:amidohydrolase [Vibrio sp. MACH09]|uniref:amidohydrolase n=1 Tax=unclassified Vibrio TaxID=2614977 RepID=UPI001493B57C|nr:MULTISPECIES: amidohydrolase [unclassified Vibrio]NOI68272.1 amidohydrolase [Vibrio sp. 99-8-1]GLO62008.1 amidohydrolase [Vibrio sp. MACH09]
MKQLSAELISNMVSWRHHIHQRPEIAFDVVETAAFVSESLKSAGIEVHEGIGKVGVVGVLRCGDNPQRKSIALRADLDAIAIEEENEFDYKSLNANKMHACGHDGHTAMLLGAAHHLAKFGDFEGTVYFIFQPDEEYGMGAKSMLEDGLFERFPADEVYGMHNLPGLELGKIEMRVGGTMASETLFDIKIKGQGGHASSPHRINDPIVVAAQVMSSVQAIVARAVDPLEATVVSITEVITDGARNVIPSNINIKGDSRTFSNENIALVEKRMREIVEGSCAAFGMEGEVSTVTEFPVSYNAEAQTAIAERAAKAVVGEQNVTTGCVPKSFSEDFAFLAKEVPACYVFIGNGVEGSHGMMLHNPKYDFNDDALEIGASYWCQLVEVSLAK